MQLYLILLILCALVLHTLMQLELRYVHILHCTLDDLYVLPMEYTLHQEILHLTLQYESLVLNSFL